MKWCNVIHNFYTGAQANSEDENASPLPAPNASDWVLAEPPVVPVEKVAYWAASQWNFVTDMEQAKKFNTRVRTKREFRSRFTQQEIFAIDNFEHDDVLGILSISPLSILDKAKMRSMREARLDAVDIDPCSVETIFGVQLLASLGLIAEERVDEILEV